MVENAPFSTSGDVAPPIKCVRPRSTSLSTLSTTFLWFCFTAVASAATGTVTGQVSTTTTDPTSTAAGKASAATNRAAELDALPFWAFLGCLLLAGGVLCLVAHWHSKAAELIKAGGSATLSDALPAVASAAMNEVPAPALVISGPTEPTTGTMVEYVVHDAELVISPQAITGVQTGDGTDVLKWKGPGRFGVSFPKAASYELTVTLADSNTATGKVKAVDPAPKIAAVPIILGHWGSLAIALVGAGGIFMLLGWGKITDTGAIALAAIFGLGAAVAKDGQGAAAKPGGSPDPPA